MTDRPHIRVEMLSNPQYLAGARELISCVAKRVGFDDMACSQIALAVDEALCNVIRHGYDCDSDRPIWISLWPSGCDDEDAEDSGCEACLRIVIEDEAKQVDEEEIQGRELADVRPGGLGVHIIREIMDEVLFEKRENNGMRLTLVKRQCAAPDDSAGSMKGAT